jgi:hypothetical protein
MDPDAVATDAADAVGSLFHASQFLEQMAVQALVPLSVVYLVIAHSFAAAANVLSVPRPFHCGFAAIFAFAQLISMMPLAVLVGWAMRGPTNVSQDASSAVLRADVVAIAAIFLMHRLAISIKYAFQPRAVYARRMRRWVTYQERLDDQLFASWFKLTRPTIEREVKAATAALTEDEATAAFGLAPASLARLRASLHAEARADLDGAAEAQAPGAPLCRLPASTLAAALLSHVNEVTSWHVLTLQRATTVAGLVSMFSTTFLRASQGLPILGDTALETSIIISAWVSNFLLLPTAFTFLSVGIVDHSRRERALDALSRLCRPSSLGSGGAGTVGMLAEAVTPPTLPLESVSDVRAFLATRSLLLSFGAGFHSRLVTVISADLIVALAVAAFCIYTVLTVSIATSATALLAPLVLHHALVVPALVLCGLGLLVAARTNVAAASGATVLAQARLLVRVKARADEGAQAVLVALMDDVERLLRDNAAPVTVLGVPATPALTNALLGGFFSLETVLVSGAATRLSASALAAQQLPASQGAAASPSPSPSPSPAPQALGPGGIDVPSAVAVGYFFAAVMLASVAAALVQRCRQGSQEGGAGAATPVGSERSLPRPAKRLTEEAAGAAAGAAAPVVALDNPLLRHAKPTSARPEEEPSPAPKARPVDEPPPASAEWVRRSDSSGDVWWENLRTQETTWDAPPGCDNT